MFEAGFNTRQESKLRNPKEAFEAVSEMLARLSRDVSTELEDRFGVSKLIDDECCIDMEAYRKINPELCERHITETKDQEMEWSGVHNPNTRSFRIERYGLEEDATPEEITKRYLDERAKEKSRILEMMITVLLHKAFGEKFIVVRSAKYDDYFGGIDNVIMNKETGDVICAFDEVRKNPRSDRTHVKAEKVVDTARKGGAELVYGFTIEDGQFKLKSMDHLPIFYLGLDENEYDELASSIQYDGTSDMNEVEKEIIGRLIESMRTQKQGLLDDSVVASKSGVVANLLKVDELLVH